MNNDDLFEAALKLPKRTRAKLVDCLRKSLEANEAIDRAIEKAERDWQAYKRGAMKGRLVEEVFPALGKKRKSP